MVESSPSNYGQVRELCAQNGDWVIDKRRLDNYFYTGRKEVILSNALDANAYKLISNLCSPSLPEEKTYSQITQLFDKHFKVSESVFVVFKNAHENAKEWAARIRSLALNCSFEEAFIDMMLRDRFVIGFEKGAIQSNLFKEMIMSTFSEVFEVDVDVVEMTAGKDRDNKTGVKQKPRIQYLSQNRSQ